MTPPPIFGWGEQNPAYGYLFTGVSLGRPRLRICTCLQKLYDTDHTVLLVYPLVMPGSPPMTTAAPFLAKPRSEEAYIRFPRCTANSIFPVERIALQDGHVRVQLRTSPSTSLWMHLQEVELIDPVRRA